MKSVTLTTATKQQRMSHSWQRNEVRKSSGYTLGSDRLDRYSEKVISWWHRVQHFDASLHLQVRKKQQYSTSAQYPASLRMGVWQGVLGHQPCNGWEVYGERMCSGNDVCAIMIECLLFIVIAYCSRKEWVHVPICSAMYLSYFVAFIASGYVMRGQYNFRCVTLKKPDLNFSSSLSLSSSLRVSNCSQPSPSISSVRHSVFARSNLLRNAQLSFVFYSVFGLKLSIKGPKYSLCIRGAV
jgi:hypothetical protein